MSRLDEPAAMELDEDYERRLGRAAPKREPGTDEAAATADDAAEGDERKDGGDEEAAGDEWVNQGGESDAEGADTGANGAEETGAGDGGDGDEDEVARHVEESQLRRDQRDRRRKKTRYQQEIVEESFSNRAVQKELCDPQAGAFGRYVDVISKISHGIDSTDVSSAVKDAGLLDKMAGFGGKQAMQLTSVVTVSAEEVCKRFAERFPRAQDDEEGAGAAAGTDEQSGSRGIQWARFGGLVAHLFAAVTPTSFMYDALQEQAHAWKGVLGIQHKSKEKKARNARRSADASDDDEPLAGTQQRQAGSDAAEVATMTDARVADLHKALPIEPTCLFTVLLHPKSFTQSVENLFDLTFLIRKGQACVSIDPELGIPTVRRIEDAEAQALGDEGEEGEEGGDGGAQKNFQCIMKLDVARWQELVEAFAVKGKPWLPDRTDKYKEAARQEKAAAGRGGAGAGGAGGRNAASAGAAAAAASSSGAAAAAAAPSGSAARRPPGQSGSKRSRPATGANLFSPSQPTMFAHAAAPSSPPPSSGHAARRRKSNTGAAAAQHSGDDDDGADADEAGSAQPAHTQADDGSATDDEPGAEEHAAATPPRSRSGSAHASPAQRRGR